MIVINLIIYPAIPVNGKRRRLDLENGQDQTVGKCSTDEIDLRWRSFLYSGAEVELLDLLDVVAAHLLDHVGDSLVSEETGALLIGKIGVGATDTIAVIGGDLEGLLDHLSRSTAGD